MTHAWADSRIENDIAGRTSARRIAGIDEVGRGAFAGPLVTCCYVRNIETILPPVKDSKMLSPSARRTLVPQLLTASDGWSIGVVHADEIDDHGMAWAINACFNRALAGLRSAPDLVFYDGRPLDIHHPCARAVIHGDATHATIAAASIIAKVVRDLFLIELDAEHPEYAFGSHKGYGTAKHRHAISDFGLIQGVHRTTFIHDLAGGKKRKYT